MHDLQISENILKLRQKKNITQDMLATFLGVTKASVSKWETGQSYPDILLLPQIASYFNISIDDLLGYSPILSTAQIKKLYQDLASDFAAKPFLDVMTEIDALVKKYHSCYPFLFQMSVLWLNHLSLAPDQEAQCEMIDKIITLCNHIEKNCENITLCSESLAIRAIATLQKGSAQYVVEMLENSYDPKHFSHQIDTILIQAYQMTGNSSKAELLNQVSIYTQILSAISSSIQLIQLKNYEKESCIETIARTSCLIDTYEIDVLHPNTALQFYYHTALFYSVNGDPELARSMLKKFVNGSISFIEQGVTLHGDSYFTRLQEWLMEFETEMATPRDLRVIMDSVQAALTHPLLTDIVTHKDFIPTKKKLQEHIEQLYKSNK